MSARTDNVYIILLIELVDTDGSKQLSLLCKGGGTIFSALVLTKTSQTYR